MRRLACISVALALGASPAALAQVSQAFQYDANGRLTGVTTTGPAGTNTAAYAYDDADNRTSRSQTGTTAYAALSRLPVDDDLGPRQALASLDGRYRLAVWDAGSVQLRPGDTVVWSNQTGDLADAIFTVNGEGSARFRQTDEEDLRVGAYLALQDDGDLVLRNSADALIPRFNTCCR